MSTPPAAPPNGSRSAALQFLKKLGLILAAALGVVFVAALALGQFNSFGLSNMLFWASLVVLGLAVVPAIVELGSGFTVVAKSAIGKEKPLQSVLADKHAQRDRWLNSSVMYGAAGVMLFILSFLVATLFSPP